MDKIADQVDKTFKNLKSDKKFNHWADKSNQSKVTHIDYIFNSLNAIAIQCFDWTKKLYENGWKDSFNLFNKETAEFLRSLN